MSPQAHRPSDGAAQGSPGAGARLTVAIATYASRRAFLEQVITSALAQDCGVPINHLVVVDNEADEQTKEFLADLSRREPRLVVTTHDVNQGAAGAIAAALQSALDLGDELVWLLDDDTRPEPGALAELLAERNRRPGAVVVALRDDLPRLISYVRGGSLEDNFGYPNNFLGVSWRDGLTRVRRAFGPADARDHFPDDLAELDLLPSREVPWATTAGMLLSRGHLLRFGLPRRDFFLYGDDVEFSMRMSRAGAPIVVVPRSRLVTVEPTWGTDNSVRPRWFTPHLRLEADPFALDRTYYVVRNQVVIDAEMAVTRGWEYRLNTALYMTVLWLLCVLAVVTGRGRAPFAYLRAVREGRRHARLGILGQRHARTEVSTVV